VSTKRYLKWKRWLGRHLTLDVKDTYWFSIVVERDLDSIFVCIHDYADVYSSAAAGVEMVARGIATPEEFAEHLERAEKHKPLPRNLLRAQGFTYDCFLHCWTRFYFYFKGWNLRKVKREMEKLVDSIFERE